MVFYDADTPFLSYDSTLLNYGIITCLGNGLNLYGHIWISYCLASYLDWPFCVSLCLLLLWEFIWCSREPPPFQWRGFLGYTSFWAQGLQRFVLPGGKVLRFLDIWRQWVTWSWLSRAMYQPSWGRWGGQIPVMRRASEKLWKWKDSNVTPRNNPTTSVMC